MVRRSTWILLGLFAVLAIGTVILQKTGQLEASTESTPFPTAAPVLGLDTGQITDIEIEQNQGDRIAFTLAGNNAWQISEPEKITRDLTQAQTALSGIATSWTIQNPLANPPALHEIGLENPLYKITIRFDNGQQRVINIGNLTPTSSGYYAQMEGGAPFVVNKSSVDQVLNLLDLLIEPTEIPTMESSPISGTASP